MSSFSVKTKKTVAIVGGGAVGATTAIEAIQQLIGSGRAADTCIRIFEPSGQVGRGLAFGAQNPRHLLNMRVDQCSIDRTDPADFLKWLRQSGQQQTLDRGPDSYVDRRTFGDYVQNRFETALDKARVAGLEIRVSAGSVVGITNLHNGLRLHSSEGDTLDCDAAVLCLGNHRPTNYIHLKGRQGYVGHAWPDYIAGEAVTDAQNVWLLGTSLTAVDALITLDTAGYRGHVNCVSRSGILPSVRPFQYPFTLNALHPAHLHLMDAIFGCLGWDLLRFSAFTELKGCGVETEQLIAELKLRLKVDPMEQLAKDIDRAYSPDPVYSLLKCLDEHVPEIWRQLSRDGKIEFSKHHALWQSLCYPMPIRNAKFLHELMLQKRLTVHGGLDDVAAGDREFLVHYRDRSGAPKISSADIVINATGASVDISAIDSPLIKGLLANGMIRPHEFGGVDVEFGTGQAINRSGVRGAPLYVVGTLTKGTHFFTNAIWENALCARRAVQHAVNEFHFVRTVSPITSYNGLAGMHFEGRGAETS
jgi:uncharacterized NAD(P)/FAD-binding protein YdhS